MVLSPPALLIRESAMNLERHQRKCQACHHADLGGIQRDFMASVACFQLDQEYDLADGCARRHALAAGWYEERQKSSMATLDRFVEQGLAKGRVGALRVSAANVLRALELRAKISGEMVERRLDLSADFEGRSVEELEFYARNGRWPVGAEIQLVQGTNGAPH